MASLFCKWILNSWEASLFCTMGFYPWAIGLLAESHVSVREPGILMVVLPVTNWVCYG